VWEPGAWNAPAASRETVHLDPKHLEAVRKGDALSFGLKLQRGGLITSPSAATTTTRS